MECGHSSDFVLASPCSPRVPVFLVILVFHVLLYSSVVSEALGSWRYAAQSLVRRQAVQSQEISNTAMKIGTYKV